jgi:SAM-dependent methyltransferase
MISSELKMPDADSNGFVKTLNNMGFMTVALDEFSKEFVQFAVESKDPVLDIGCAYGNAVLPALQGGARVFANDVDPRHLEIVAARASEVGVEEQLVTLPGGFPDGLDIQASTLSAVLACRVFHFFDGPTIERAVKKIASWLKPGGKFFLVSETPYVGGVKPFIPIYEERIQQGDKWPGYIDDFMKVDPVRGKDLPKTMHLLDENVLRRTFEAAGFVVERAHKFARPGFPDGLRLDGRESVGIVGRKPE